MSDTRHVLQSIPTSVRLSEEEKRFLSENNITTREAIQKYIEELKKQKEKKEKEEKKKDTIHFTNIIILLFIGLYTLFLPDFYNEKITKILGIIITVSTTLRLLLFIKNT